MRFRLTAPDCPADHLRLIRIIVAACLREAWQIAEDCHRETITERQVRHRLAEAARLAMSALD